MNFILQVFNVQGVLYTLHKIAISLPLGMYRNLLRYALNVSKNISSNTSA
jgi:hypothetical protein